MNVTVCNEKTRNKTLEFSKSFWTGKMTLKLDDAPLERIGKKVFTFTDEEANSHQIAVFGSELTGIDLQFDGGEKVNVLRKLKTYEMIISVLPLWLLIEGGLLGGIFGAVGFIINVAICRTIQNSFAKVMLSLLVLIVDSIIVIILATNLDLLIKG